MTKSTVTKWNMGKLRLKKVRSHACNSVNDKDDDLCINLLYGLFALLEWSE